MRTSIIMVIMGILLVSCQMEEYPNIIYIYTDQQGEAMMSCAGNEFLHTPAMDYIADNGIRFTRAYTSNPVCAPARVSMMTGRFPGYFMDKDGNMLRENGGARDIPEVSEKGYKYIRYDAVGIEEQLMDLNNDPYETRHFTSDKAYSEVLSGLRESYKELWFPN